MNEFDELVDKWLDGEICPEDVEKLNQHLRGNRSAQKEFAEQIRFHSTLRKRHRVDGKVFDLLTEVTEKRGTEIRKTSPLKTFSQWLAISTAVLTLLILLVSAIPPRVETFPEENQMTGLAPVDSSPPAARVPAATISRSINVQWQPAGERWSVGDIVHQGDEIHLENGSLEILFDSGAVMALVGPAHLQVRSSHIVMLQAGTATTRVENVESGLFRVLTPWTEVIDLGTEFGVRVDPAKEEAEVVVFDGAVDLVPVKKSVSASSSPRTLQRGEAVRVMKSGGMERVISVDNAAYPFGDGIFTAPPKRQPIITRVTDDRRDPNSPKFYRIYHQGLDEDAPAYVDRVHEWNGVTKEGIPYFLRGADYIATFNDDKYDSPKITVHLSQPAILYVFFDRRMKTPKWLSESFEDTGFKIGLDEGPSLKESYDLGVGPGVSIETVHSVWRQVIKQPRNITLGTIGNSMRGRSMYGIASQPLE